MFNQSQPARTAIPWQPNAGIAKKLSSRGYATTSWTSDAPQEYAELGYPAKSSGFSAAHYQPTRQPLSAQAKASLALLEDEYHNETLGEEKPPSHAGTETNEHLPFVMDHFGATRKSKLRVNVDAHVLQRAMAQADLAETLVVSPITAAENMAEPIVIHPDVYDADSEVAPGGSATLSAEVLPEEEIQNTDEVHPEVALADVESAPVVDVALPEPQPEPEPEPALPAVVGGIAPDEVAQREAEQFAKGLAQAQEEAAMQLKEAVEKAMAEGLAQGLAQGKAEGVSEGLEQGLAQGKAQGLAEGEETARQALADEMAAQRVVFEKAGHELGALMADPKKFFEPLKRLAVHIAEQVVVGELQTSHQAIERLVQRCLDALEHPVQGAVVLELNPQDKERLLAGSADFVQGMRLEAVHDMPMGSVRVFANDTVIEDLVSHRLEGLARALLVNVDAWREQSPLVEQNSEIQEEAEGDDVHS